jgi:hypothetical protein
MPNEGSAQRFQGFRSLGIERPKCVPFGDESRCWELFSLQPWELRLVVAVMAAEACGIALVTTKQVMRCCDLATPRSMSSLAARRWVESPDKITKSRERLWRTSRRAWRELGFVGWQVKLHTEEELAELRAEGIGL